MSARSRIIKLHKKGRLEVVHPDLRPVPGTDVDGFCRKVTSGILSNDVFEFCWPRSDIWIDEQARTHYPHIGDDELREAVRSPVPHEQIWLETDVWGTDGRCVTYGWLIEQLGTRGFRAFPVVLNGDRLAVSGATIQFEPEGYVEGDELPEMRLSIVFCNYESYGEPEEFKDQCEVISRFMRILSHPRAIIDLEDAGLRAPGIDRTRISHEVSVLPRRATVRIDPEAYKVEHHAEDPERHRSPAEHHRRAHTRRLPDGRVILVRNCVVNPGKGAPGLPQQYVVC